MRLGLSTREIAAAAGVTHGTVRSISNRLSAKDGEGQPTLELTADEWFMMLAGWIARDQRALPDA